MVSASAPAAWPRRGSWLEEGAAVVVSEKRSAGRWWGWSSSTRSGVRARGRAPARAPRRGHAGGGQPRHAERRPAIRVGHDRRIPVWSELELGARLCPFPTSRSPGRTARPPPPRWWPRPCGRGLDARLREHRLPVLAGRREDHDALVVEASSFQLRFHRTFHPRVSVLLNLAPDHIDWHGSFEAYAAAKAWIYRAPDGDDVHVGNRDDASRPGGRLSSGRSASELWFTLAEPGPGEVGWWSKGGLVSRLARQGTVGRAAGRAPQGFVADATAAPPCRCRSAPDAGAAAGIAWRPLPHRARGRHRRRTSDSSTTRRPRTPTPRLAALQGMTDAVLIAGGQAKGSTSRRWPRCSRRWPGSWSMERPPTRSPRCSKGVPKVRRASIEEAARKALDLASRRGHREAR